MFGFSMGEMMLLAAIALIAIGPKQLPEVARTLGRFMNELKRATGDFTKAFTDVRDDTKTTWSDARKGFNDTFTAGAASYNSSQTVRAAPEGTVSSTGAPSSTGPSASDAPPVPKFPITPDDPFGSGHNANAYPIAPEGFEAQGSLFVPTDLSHEHQAAKSESPVVEQQLEFRLTSFDDNDEHGNRGDGRT